MIVWETWGFCLQPENKKQWSHSLHSSDRKFWRIVDGSSATLVCLLACALHLVCLYSSVVLCMIFSSGNILQFLLSLHCGSEPVHAVVPFSVSDKRGSCISAILKLLWHSHKKQKSLNKAQTVVQMPLSIIVFICFQTWTENINLSDSVPLCISCTGNLYGWKC
jgi:hypothetical protein